MKVCYLSDLNKVEIKEMDIPPVDDESVLIKIKAAGVCGSDFHAFFGTHPFRHPPMVLGHEATGEVVRMGAKVQQLKIGDRVTVEPVKTCGKCSFCLSGHYNVCPEKVMAGVGGWLGTFAEYFVIEEQRVHKLPEELDYDTGVLAEPLAVGAHAIRLAGVKSGLTCAVLGTGTIGLLAGIAAQEAGADQVFCTDINPFRLKIAKKMGLYPIRADQVSVEDTIRSLVPDGPDVVLLALSSPIILDQGLKLVKRGGKMVVIAVFSRLVSVSVNSVQVNEIDLKGSNIYTKEDFQTALEILTKRKNDFQKVITQKIGFEQVNATLNKLSNPDFEALKIIVQPSRQCNGVC